MAKQKEEKVETKVDIVPEGATSITDVEPPKELLTKYDEILEETSKEVTEELKEDLLKEATEPAGEEVEEEVPERLVESARALGFTDQQIESKDKTELELLDKTYRQLVEARTIVKEAPKLEPEPKKPEQVKHVELPDLRDFDEQTAETIKTLISGQNALIDQLNVSNERLDGISQQVSSGEAVRQREYDKMINSVFDETNNSDFGKTNVLSKEQLAYRQEIYLTAAVIARQRGVDVKDALRGVVKIVANFGKVRETDVDKAAKLEKQKAKMTIRPTGQKTAKYSDMQPRDREYEKFSEKWSELVGA